MQPTQPLLNHYSRLLQAIRSLFALLHLDVDAVRRYSALVAALAGVFAATHSYAAAPSQQIPAMPSLLASKALLTASAQSGGHMVAVGAYGNIIYSAVPAESKAPKWHQANVPTQRLLTCVTFIDEREGWAGGHDALILHTTDGGENWQIQFEDPKPKGDLPKPIMAIEFSDKLNGIAVGAFSLMLKTADGGKTWVPVETGSLYDELEAKGQEPEPNLYAIVKLDDGFLIVGELGTLLEYSPAGKAGGEPWRIIKSPYEGTFFGARQFSSGDIFIYGLRGHLFRSVDQGENWQAITTGITENINDVIEVSNNRLIGVGDGGTVLDIRRYPDGATAEKISYPGFSNLMSAQATGTNSVMLFGSMGAQLFPVGE